MSVPSEGFIRRADLAVLADAADELAQEAKARGLIPPQDLVLTTMRVAAYLDAHPPMSAADPRSSAPPG